MKEASIVFKQSQIHYTILGKGGVPVIAFHGYGEDGNNFSLLEGYLPADKILISITLPLHGQTTWKEPDYCRPQDIIDIIELILKTEKLPLERFSLMGYSLGGRICLKLLEVYPQRINHTLLLAPDGIKMFLLQYMATQNVFSKALFSYTIRHPQWFLGLIKCIRFCKLVPANIANFVYQLMDDKEERNRLYNRWMMFKYMHPHIQQVKNSINQYQKKVDIIIGEYDSLIKPATIESFPKGINPEFITIHRFPTGHILIKEKFAAEIAGLM